MLLKRPVPEGATVCQWCITHRNQVKLPRTTVRRAGSGASVDGDCASGLDLPEFWLMIKKLWNLLLAVLMLVIIALIVTLPATWMLMLFLGNIGVNLSYWGTLPLGIVVSLLIGAGGSNDTFNTLNVFSDD